MSAYTSSTAVCLRDFGSLWLLYSEDSHYKVSVWWRRVQWRSKNVDAALRGNHRPANTAENQLDSWQQQLMRHLACSGRTPATGARWAGPIANLLCNCRMFSI